MRLRRCRYCDVVKDFSEFVPAPKGKFGISWQCLKCRKAMIPRMAQHDYPVANASSTNGYCGAAIYILWFDNRTLFYIGSCVNAKIKCQSWVHKLLVGRCNKKMQLRITNKMKFDFEILEKIDNKSMLFEREEWYINNYANDSRILNASKSAYGRGLPIPLYDGSPIAKEKPVNQYKNGVLIKTHNSIVLAAKYCGVSICSVFKRCHGEYTHPIRGYTFAFDKTSKWVQVRNAK